MEIKGVIIIGSGPAGYTAGIYTGRAMLKTLMFSGDIYGGQLMNTTEVENYPGFENGINGPKLMSEMRNQMLRFGVGVDDTLITRVDFQGDVLKVWQGDKEYKSRAVIIATGAQAMMLNLKDEDRYIGRGLSTCAVCDAAFYRDKDVFVVGGGDSAIEDAMALTKFAKSVRLVVRRGELRASKIMQQKVMNHPKVEILWHHEVMEISGEARIQALKLRDNGSEKTYSVSADGLFYAIGHVPSSKIFESSVELNSSGYILNSENGLKKYGNVEKVMTEGFMTMTSVSGVFAAGDVVDFRFRQAITAAASGCRAALDVEKYLENIK